jgi:hypothetical protein
MQKFREEKGNKIKGMNPRPSSGHKFRSELQGMYRFRLVRRSLRT